ncbi:hypothetical protein [Shimia sp.]|uniref:hypothetical protein n=1 Tax=Shimia sp. TaxID=1954381 RepID=UPI00329A1484
MRDDSNYLEALKEIAEQSRRSVAISSVPLGIVLVQLRYLASVDSIWLQLIATVAVSSLFIATFLAWYVSMTVQSTFELELYRRDGNESQKGRLYYDWVLSIAKNPNVFTEPHAVSILRKLVGPFWAFASIGYVALITLILSLIWSSP